MCVGTRKHSSAATDKLQTALALFVRGGLVFVFVFLDLTLNPHSLDWIINFSPVVKPTLRGYLLLSIFLVDYRGKCVFCWYNPVGNASFSSFWIFFLADGIQSHAESSGVAHI